MSISILIADADGLLRDLLAALLGRDEAFQIAGCAADAETAIQGIAELAPDVVLLDLQLPGSDAFRVLNEVINRPFDSSLSEPKVLVMGRDNAEAFQLEAARRGAQGFLCKAEGVSALTNAICAVMAGEVWFSRQIVAQTLREYTRLLRQVEERSRPSNVLSPREREILALVARGLTNQRIAEDLTMSLGTVKVHIRNIFQKLDLPNRTEAAVYALKEGLLNDSSHPRQSNRSSLQEKRFN